LVAEATDLPVWFLFVATVCLVGVTAWLAIAATSALTQIVEAQRDRNVTVFAGLAERWQSFPIAEALELEQDYTPTTLAELYAKRGEEPHTDPSEEAQRKEDVQARVKLTRIPNYFEDALMIARVGGLVENATFNEFLSGIAVQEWELWGPTLKQMQSEDDLAYIEFERYALQEIARDETRRAARAATDRGAA
jgi:hypothetical protein